VQPFDPLQSKEVITKYFNQIPTNSDLLLRIHRLTEATSRKVMSPAKLRELLNLQPGHGKYGRSF
jgi:hypothetical protein